MMKGLAAILPALAALPAAAQPQGLQQRVEAVLAEAGPGVRFGLVMADADGKELVAVNPEQRFVPASNTKIFTTAAAYATLAGLDAPDTAGGATVRIERGDVILTGNGDARLSAAPDCVTDCLAALAEAVAAKRRRVRDVVGDDRLFHDERWSAGMSWNNIPTRSGTAISALTVDSNELLVRVTPGAPGAAPTLEHLPYYEIDNRAVTVAEGATNLDFDRLPFERKLRLTGTVATGGDPVTLRLGIDDPAHFAAWQLKRMLEARGVRVNGAVLARHRPRPPADDPRASSPPEPLARLTPPPLAEDIAVINKVSQNLHAELLLRRLGLEEGKGSVADGLLRVRAMLERAGLPRWTWDLSDGSGMSTYNRIAPRAMVTLLRWIDAQPWGAAWRATLPVAGMDGTLSRRFKGTSLEGRLFAKTGSINATNALAGYLVTRGGRTLTFAAYANDVPEDVAATKAIDAALLLVAEEN